MSTPQKSHELTRALEFAFEPDETAHTRIGPYQLLEKIGEGGFGVVWMAEQQEPVRRRVALKIIKAGMDTRELIARFEAERQALALMEHPHIARVFDAGATETGRPYFVMELVRGTPITQFCDENRVPTEARLRLFIDVCQAVQHAHQKGIIHRDLKPSNILITLHNDKPVPKVIDFGIAKALGGAQLTDKTLFTRFHTFIGTPAYTSPEQIGMSGLDIDTRSDIYSLGVLLYVLLAGQPPFDAAQLDSAGLDGARRTILEIDPPRPSQRLRTLAPRTRDTIARQRATDAAKLSLVLRGDLDWVVMRCLEKDRARRYESAAALAADVQRHLANEPVVARPPSAAYTLQKLVRRHRVAFASAGAIAVTLVFGIAASTWQTIRATRAEREQTRLREAAERAQVAETTLRGQAQLQELAVRRRAYAADLNLAQQAIADDKLGRAQELLNRQRPQPGEPDLRGWEWRYLWQFCQNEATATLAQLDRPARVLSLSADGRWFVTCNLRAAENPEHPFWLGEIGTRKAHPIFLDEQVFAAVFSPKAPLLAVGVVKAANVHQVRLVNPATKETIREWRLPTRGRDLYFSSDGETLLTITRGRVTQFVWWRVADGRQLAKTEYAPQDYPFVSTWVVTPDLRLGAYRKDEAGIHLIDLKTGEERWTVQAANETLTTMAFSPDGMLLASTGSAGESDIRLWDVATGKEAGRLAGHRTFVQSLLFWPDGKTLASGGADQTIRLWDVASRRLLRTLRGHTQEVWSLALMPDQRTFASGSKDGAIFTWAIERAPRAPAHVKLPRPLESWRFAADSQSILSVTRTGDLVRWLGRTFTETHANINVGDRGDSGDWSKHVVQEGALIATAQDGRVRIWDLGKRQLVREVSANGTLVGFRDGGEKLLLMRASWSGGPDGNGLHEWNVTTGVKSRSWMTSDPWGAVLHALPSGRQQCLVRCKDGTVSLIDLDTGDQRTFQLDGRTGENFDLSPDGQLFAAPNRLGWIGVWETKTFRRVATLSGFAPGIYSATFSPDGRRLAAGGDAGEAIRLWNVDGWEPVLTLSSPGHAFESTSFSPDGNVLGSKTFVGELHLWRAPSWAEIEAAEKEGRFR